MVAVVSSEVLQDTLDQMDHMFRYGLNVPNHFLVHDVVSLRDLFEEWVEKYDYEHINMHAYHRESAFKVKKNFPKSVETLKDHISDDMVTDFYFLVTPYVDETDFVLSGYVKSPTEDDPDVTFGYRGDHHIPYVESEDYPCKKITCDVNGSVPHSNNCFDDIKRMARGFPYQGVRLTWSLTKDVIGRNKTHICFWDYQVDEAYVRE